MAAKNLQNQEYSTQDISRFLSEFRSMYRFLGGADFDRYAIWVANTIQSHKNSSYLIERDSWSPNNTSLSANFIESLIASNLSQDFKTKISIAKNPKRAGLPFGFENKSLLYAFDDVAYSGSQLVEEAVAKAYSYDLKIQREIEPKAKKLKIYWFLMAVSQKALDRLKTGLKAAELKHVDFELKALFRIPSAAEIFSTSSLEILSKLIEITQNTNSLFAMRTQYRFPDGASYSKIFRSIPDAALVHSKFKSSHFLFPRIPANGLRSYPKITDVIVPRN